MIEKRQMLLKKQTIEKYIPQVFGCHKQKRALSIESALQLLFFYSSPLTTTVPSSVVVESSGFVSSAGLMSLSSFSKTVS